MIPFPSKIPKSEKEFNMEKDLKKKKAKINSVNPPQSNKQPTWFKKYVARWKPLHSKFLSQWKHSIRILVVAKKTNILPLYFTIWEMEAQSHNLHLDHIIS